MFCVGIVTGVWNCIYRSHRPFSHSFSFFSFLMLGVLVFLILVARPLPPELVRFLSFPAPSPSPLLLRCLFCRFDVSESVGRFGLVASARVLHFAALALHFHFCSAYFYTSSHSGGRAAFWIDSINFISLFFEIQTNCTCMKRKRKCIDFRVSWEKHFRFSSTILRNAPALSYFLFRISKGKQSFFLL